MIYNLDEQATLFERGIEVAHGRLRDLIADALGWDAARFAAARIVTVTQENYAPDMIREVADEAGIAHPVQPARE